MHKRSCARTCRDLARAPAVGGGVAGLTLATRLGQTLGCRGVARVSLATVATFGRYCTGKNDATTTLR